MSSIDLPFMSKPMVTNSSFPWLFRGTTLLLSGRAHRHGRRKKADLISIEEYEARTKRRKKHAAERKAHTHSRRERAAS